MRMKTVTIGLFLVFGVAAHGQESASLSGGVIDSALGLVSEAKVTLSDLKRGSRVQSVTNINGIYVFEGLQPGEFLLEAEKEGFKKLRVERLRLASRDRVSLTLKLETAEEGKTAVTLGGDVEAVSVDLSSGLALEREYVENLPINGRNIQTLLLFMPGVVNPAGGIGGVDELNVNGLRASANYYMVDGVNANRGAAGRGGAQGAGGGGRGGRGGAGTAVGRGSATGFANDLIPMEAIEQVRVQTSTFSPEFGRTPGAQVSLTSRAGTNLWRGSFFMNYGLDGMTSPDWFATRYGLTRGGMEHGNYGASIGGPVVRDTTYFFAAYEGLRSTHPETSVNYVPDAASRAAASAALRPYLDAFPLPNRTSTLSGVGIFASSFTNPFDADSASLRVDHSFSEKLQGFIRAGWMPSKRSYRGDDLTTANVITDADNKPWAAVAALTWTPSSRTSNDLRFGFSQNGLTTSVTSDTFGGARPLSGSLIYPAGINAGTAEYRMGVLGLAGYSASGGARTGQMQWNIVNNLTSIKGAHTIKTGVDFRRTSPTYFQRPYAAEVTFNGLSGSGGTLLSGIATAATVTSNITRVEPVLNNFSFFFQDNWKADDKTTVTYGFRWDVNPAPDVRSGSPPFALGSDVSSVTRFSPLYKTRWADIGPRFGMVHQLENAPGWEAVLRMGVGVFYDLGYGTTMSAFNGVPYSSQRNLSLAAFPLAPANILPPALPAARPYGQLSVSDPLLQSPRSTQWNISLEQTIAHKQTLTMSYIGTQGRKLMLTETQAAFSSDYDFLRLTTNGANSDYHAAQIQYRRRFSADLLAQVSYTYSSAIDTLPADSSRGGFATILSDERGASDFDVRHNLAASASYRLPGVKQGAARALLGDWWVDSVVFARTAMPMDVLSLSEQESDSETGFGGAFAQVRPNYNGLPAWLKDGSAPGGRRLNPEAFSAPEGFAQGNLGRNAIRGFKAIQLDVSLRKQLQMGERARAQIFAQAFNVFNTANFANPSTQEGANLASPVFGYATRALNLAGGGGAGSMYRIGSPRTVQVGLRFTF
ncbi:MAG: hypothetical protein C0504_08120 [Candidatus Solibacter sp.]|nr:hypothetical protein [Candidatus Solibacter sp.]